VVTLAMLPAVDRMPLLLITPRVFDAQRGLLEVRYAKTAKRPRTIELSTPALEILRRRCAGLGLDDPIFRYTKGQVRHRWQDVRDRAAGRPRRADPGGAGPGRSRGRRAAQAAGHRHPTDAQVHGPPASAAQAWNVLGLPPEDLKGIMGWAADSNMASRHTTARIRGDRDHLDRVAELLRLDTVGKYGKTAAGTLRSM
jgi:hypothetical protein